VALTYRREEGDKPKRVGIFVGPEFGAVSRLDRIAAAPQLGDAGSMGREPQYSI